MIDQSISHYRIVEKIGEGGMGVVYRARDTHLLRDVAIKVLRRTADPERKRRFIQEAMATSSLNHPNIVTIHDSATEEGCDYIVMEFVEGRTLQELVAGKRLRVELMLQYAVQIADALAKAHAAGILHRDLKPANIMIGPDERVKVLDFGLAKVTDIAATSEDDLTKTIRAQAPLTEEGIALGTVSYMSPEQAEFAGGPDGQRSHAGGAFPVTASWRETCPS